MSRIIDQQGTWRVKSYHGVNGKRFETSAYFANFYTSSRFGYQLGENSFVLGGSA
jgi:hypothetical protein